MTHDEREILIDAMSVHFLRSKEELRALASNGEYYGPWLAVVKEFYRVNPHWTRENWQNRPKTLIKPDLSSILPSGIRCTDDFVFKGLGFLFFLVVVLLLWGFLKIHS